MIKYKDIIGEIVHHDGGWKLIESTVTSVTYNSRGCKVKSKRFYTLDAEDIEAATEDMQNIKGVVITREPFILNDITRPKAEAFIKWANEHPDKAVGEISGLPST